MTHTAHALIWEGRYQEAYSILTQSFQLSNDAHKQFVLAGIGDLYEHQGYFDKAIEKWREALTYHQYYLYANSKIAEAAKRVIEREPLSMLHDKRFYPRDFYGKGQYAGIIARSSNKFGYIMSTDGNSIYLDWNNLIDKRQRKLSVVQWVIFDIQTIDQKLQAVNVKCLDLVK